MTRCSRPAAWCGAARASTRTISSAVARAHSARSGWSRPRSSTTDSGGGGGSGARWGSCGSISRRAWRSAAAAVAAG
eukprot:scaffold80876_cov75-Phaeocystis_antarctica.AAC.1